MVLAVTHNTPATGSNNPAKQVSKDVWNEPHALAGVASLAQGGTSADTPIAAMAALKGVHVLAHSAVAVSCPADTTEDTLATITVPAGTMGLNGRLRVTTQWTFTNSANNKTWRVRFSGAAGTIFSGTALTTQASLRQITEISNRGAANSQGGGVLGNPTTGGWGVSTAANITSAVDTTADTTIVITGQKASSGETLTLEAYLVELIVP